MDDESKFLKRAIELAKESVKKGGFPAGALVVKDGKINLASENYPPHFNLKFI